MIIIIFFKKKIEFQNSINKRKRNLRYRARAAGASDTRNARLVPGRCAAERVLLADALLNRLIAAARAVTVVAAVVRATDASQLVLRHRARAIVREHEVLRRVLPTVERERSRLVVVGHAIFANAAVDERAGKHFELDRPRVGRWLQAGQRSPAIDGPFEIGAGRRWRAEQRRGELKRTR